MPFNSDVHALGHDCGISWTGAHLCEYEEHVLGWSLHLRRSAHVAAVATWLVVASVGHRAALLRLSFISDCMGMLVGMRVFHCCCSLLVGCGCSVAALFGILFVLQHPIPAAAAVLYLGIDVAVAWYT